MGLVRAVDAMPRIGCLAVAVTDAIKTEEDAAVMRRVDVGIVGQTARREHVALGRVEVMKYLVGTLTTFLGSLIVSAVVVAQHRPRTEPEFGEVAGLVVPGE